MSRKYGPKTAEKVEQTLHEWKRGTLRSGSGTKVTSRKQAIAIGLSQARRRGYKVPAAHATKAKTPAQLDREIAEVLAKPPTKAALKKTAQRRKHDLFYVSDDQQGGKAASHFEHYGSLTEAIEALARLPHGSITYGNAEDGPQFMIVWAAPESTDLLYWTDNDLNTQPGTQAAVKTVRNQQAPSSVRSSSHGSEQYFNNRFEKVRSKHW